MAHDLLRQNRILYYGGLWPTNMGNSFIDLGAMHLLKECFPQSAIWQASRFSAFYAQHRSNGHLTFLGNMWKRFDIAEHADVQTVAIAGNVANEDFIRIEGPTIAKLVSKGAKFFILGGGASTYTHEEATRFTKFMEEMGTAVFVSRDKESFERFGGAAKASFEGIDSGFFVSESYVPLPLSVTEDYVACSFDDQNIETVLKLGPVNIVRTRHYSFGIRERFRRKLDYTLVSDLPFDYLSIYANAKAVYSDRVHACVAAISYGVPARLISNSPRVRLFKAIGAERLTDELITIDQDVLAKKKSEEKAFLSGQTCDHR